MKLEIQAIKKIIDKGFDINNTLIDADELSPLYYAINRKERIRFGFDTFKKKLAENPYNITWNNFDMPGLTPGDKATNREVRIGKIKNVGFNFEESIMKASFTQMYGNENTFDLQIQELDKIIEYLIDKTNDIDKYVKTFDQYQGINTLFLAAEYNDVKICELLLEKGANPTKSLGETLLCTIPNDYNSLLVPGDFDHSVTGEKSQKVTRENDQKSHLTPLIIRFPEDCQKQFLPFL